MIPKTSSSNYLYTFKYDYHHSDLCKLESRQIFTKEEANKLLFSDIKVDPSISPFIRHRFKILFSSNNYPELLETIKKEKIRISGFIAEYLILEGDTTDYTERREKLKDVGYRIAGEPDFDNPSITYSICTYKNIWYFGILKKHDIDWHKHKKKPCSFSNSISMNIAKTLVSIASKGNKDIKLLDACCGVGTVMLEACCADFDIEGCDINWKACRHARENIAYYNYNSMVFCSDIKNLNKTYDAIIIDLPYNLYSYSDDSIALNIIESSVKLSNRVVIVSISDIKPLIKKSGLLVIDSCNVEKRGKSKFSRNIWVCEKENITKN